jgi:hypothetical protein
MESEESREEVSFFQEESQRLTQILLIDREFDDLLSDLSLLLTPSLLDSCSVNKVLWSQKKKSILIEREKSME